MLYVYNTDFTNEQKRALGPMLDFFGRYTGIVNVCLERDDLKKFNLNWFQTLTTKSTTLFGQNKEITTGGLGVDSSRMTALQKSFGEAIERHSLTYYDDSKFVWYSLEDMERIQPDVVLDNMSHIELPDAEMTEYYASRGERIAWQKIWRIGTNQSIYYPVGQIYIPCEGTKRLSYVTSTGVAFNKDFNATITSALLEIIERDAIILNHYFIDGFEEVDTSLVKGELLNKVISERMYPTFLRLRSDVGVPVIMCFLEADEPIGGIRFGIGCAAGLSERTAMEKSLSEALFTFHYAKNLMHLRVNKVSKIRSLYERFLYYQSSEEYKKLRKRYFIKSKSRVDPDIRVEAHNLIKMCENVYGNLYFVDITPPYVLDSGYRTTRVISLNAYDLHTREIYFNPDSSRATNFKKYCSDKEISMVSKTISLPHPMP